MEVSEGSPDSYELLEGPKIKIVSRLTLVLSKEELEAIIKDLELRKATIGRQLFEAKCAFEYFRGLK